MGLSAGSRVGMLGANSVFWIASYLAIMRAGHTAVPFAPVLTPADVRDQDGPRRVRALLLDERMSRRFDRSPTVLRPAADDAGVREALASGADARLPDARPPADAAVLVFTSGTTSGPARCAWATTTCSANTASIVDYLGLRRDDRMLVVLPFSYCFGASLLHTHLAVGASLRICETQAFPETIVEAIAADSCTGLRGGAVVLPDAAARELVREPAAADRCATSSRLAGDCPLPRWSGWCGRSPTPAVRDVRPDGGHGHGFAYLPPGGAGRAARFRGKGDPRGDPAHH